MCKEGFSVKVNGQAGRISNLRQEKGQVIGDFVERRCEQGRIVKLSEVKPSHKKAQKNIEAALRAIGINGLGQQKSINGKNDKGYDKPVLKLSKQAPDPGDEFGPQDIYA